MSSESIEQKLKKIRLLVMDVDGTITDGVVYYSKHGEELKRFSIRDGMGIELLRKGHIETATITSENSPIVTARATKLRIEHIILGSHNKKRDLISLAEQNNFTLDEIAYIGDDINDIDAMLTSGISVCPANAVVSVKQIADYVCESDGGSGAVREIAEKILISQDKSITLPENW